MQKGRVEIRIKGTMITDYQEQWTGTKFRVALKKLYNNWLIKWYLLAQVFDPYEGLMISFATDIKKFLEMKGA